jgi:hypothetical protein
MTKSKKTITDYLAQIAIWFMFIYFFVCMYYLVKWMFKIIF